jgi:hypothetical protein
MANSPCSICQRAFGRKSTFFSPQNDNKGIAQGPEVLLAPINRIKRAASIGCAICTVLISSLDTEFLPPEVKERQNAVLKRAILDSDRAVAVHVGFDDVSHTSFSRIPLSWSSYGSDKLLDYHLTYYVKIISRLRS